VTNRPHIFIIGDAHINSSERLEFLISMMKRRFDVTAFSLTEVCSLPSSISELRDAVAAEVGSVQNTHLVGFGLGASIAITLAAEAPKELRSVTLVAGWLTATPKMRALIRQLKAFENEQTRDQIFELITTSSFGWAERNLLPSQVSVSLLELGAAIDLTTTALRLRHPTLVIACTKDEFAAPEQSELIFGAISNARFATIPSGHNVVSERPAQLLSIIEPFVQNPERYPPGTVLPELQP